LVQDYINIIN